MSVNHGHPIFHDDQGCGSKFRRDQQLDKRKPKAKKMNETKRRQTGREGKGSEWKGGDRQGRKRTGMEHKREDRTLTELKKEGPGLDQDGN